MEQIIMATLADLGLSQFTGSIAMPDMIP
jgi:hypothetical protein